MALDRKCIVCPDKHHYKYCNNCNGYNSLETWRFIFCSENCRGIYKIASDFVDNIITGAEAKELLKEYDLSDLEFYQKFIKQNVLDILASTDNVVSDEKEKIENVVDESTAIQTVVVDNSEIETVTINAKTNVSNEQKNYYSKKQKYRKN